MRELLTLLLLGAALFGVKSWVAAAFAARPTLTVAVPDGASAAQRAQLMDEAVLIELALESGGARLDPVIREQLLRVMHTSRGAANVDDSTLLARAYELGVQRSDPLVRARLLYQAEQLLRARVRQHAPSEAELEAYMRDHRERYLLPARYTLTQLFFSRDRRGAALAEDVQRAGERLARGETVTADPSLWPETFEAVTASELSARFGDGFMRALERLPADGSRQLVWSSFGLHLVRLHTRSAPKLPALAAIAARVRHDWENDRFQQRARALVREQRARYELVVDASPP